MLVVRGKLGLQSLLVLAFIVLGLATTGPAKANTVQPELTSNQLYLRGAFNGWGTKHAFEASDEPGIFSTEIKVAPGNYGFKIAPADWHFEMLINPNGKQRIEVAKSYPLLVEPGQEEQLFVLETAVYQFELDLRNSQLPSLEVSIRPVQATQLYNPHEGHTYRQSVTYSTYNGKQESVVFSTANIDAPLRNYVQSSTQSLRDPVEPYVTYAELANLPRLRSGSLQHDALFSMSLQEMLLNSVENISDSNYLGGKEIPCSCFQTGEKWRYVWTRDLAYAADLSLAFMDPERTQNSLLFKTSPFRSGIEISDNIFQYADGSQIVQDTGSGGSWPISTDRVTWALGAEALLNNLAGKQRVAFAQKAYVALVNTIENDRLVAYDHTDGLYGGEQSFLDWREQSYARWIAGDLASMATAKALSTNVMHYQALSLAAKLGAELGEKQKAQRYATWAEQLKQAFNQKLWLPGQGMYSSLTAGHFDKQAMQQFDWLGQSLAIITGVADQKQARQILSNYPHGPMGAPVIFPQLPNIPVYHNRGIWPFVTAYGLTAATQAKHVAAADAAYETLIRFASLNLSNMENLEWLSGQPMWLEMAAPELSGPVINSRRQLWSVAAYLNAVIHNMFGLKLNDSELTIEPFVTAKIAKSLFADSTQAKLENLSIWGKSVAIELIMADGNKSTSDNALYQVISLAINGKDVDIAHGWDSASLPNDAIISIVLGSPKSDKSTLTKVIAQPGVHDPSVFTPYEPSIVYSKQDNSLLVSKVAATDIVDVFRNGKLWRKSVEPSSALDLMGINGCFSAIARNQKGLHSQPSQPVCVGDVMKIDANSNIASMHGKRFNFEIEKAGGYAIQAKYQNQLNSVEQGITSAVKWLSVSDEKGVVVAEGAVQMPHTLPGQWQFSSPLEHAFSPGRYQLLVRDFYNMSYLQSNTTFTRAGGSAGAVNDAQIAAFRILHID